MSNLQQFINDHRQLRQLVARQAGFDDPLLFDDLSAPLLNHATPREALTLDGVLVETWRNHPDFVKDMVQVGMQRYEIKNITFVSISFGYSYDMPFTGSRFYAVDRQDHARLRDLDRQLSCGRQERPILPEDQAEVLWNNTIGFLDDANLQRIERYGGRPQRGVLLTGSPGNGKTMACRWISQACHERGWAQRSVTPDYYRERRTQGDVDEVFSLNRRGVIFFDDMDLALRDRETVTETDDHSVFLTALDGMERKRSVVFVFTTNCSLNLIDRAFKRPGRIDVVLPFNEPDDGMRRQLIRRWHVELREQLDEEDVVASTDGFSFAEIEEIRNLLVMAFVDTDVWDWPRALDQFHTNRTDTAGRAATLGFA